MPTALTGIVSLVVNGGQAGGTNHDDGVSGVGQYKPTTHDWKVSAVTVPEPSSGLYLMLRLTARGLVRRRAVMKKSIH